MAAPDLSAVASPNRGGIPESLRELRHGQQQPQQQQFKSKLNSKRMSPSQQQVRKPSSVRWAGASRGEVDTDLHVHTPELVSQSRRASNDSSVPMGSVVVGAHGGLPPVTPRSFLLPGVKEDCDVPDRDVASVISALAERGMASGTGQLVSKEGEPGPSLAVGLIDSILLKLESGAACEVVASRFLQHSLVPVIDATCHQLKATEQRRMKLLRDVEATRDHAQKQKALHDELGEMCVTTQYTCLTRKLREASEAAHMSCELAVQEKERLDDRFANLGEEQKTLQRQLKEDELALAQESAAFLERQMQFRSDEAELNEQIAGLSERVQQVEAKLRRLRQDADAYAISCTKIDVDLEAIPVMELRLVELTNEFHELRISVRNAQLALIRKKKKRASKSPPSEKISKAIPRYLQPAKKKGEVEAS